MDHVSGIHLPPPSPATRQVGVGTIGSPIVLSRGTSSLSNQSDIRNPEETLRDYLVAYKTFLQHDIDFVNNEINALIQRPPSDNPHLDASFLQLRNSLKIRFNTLTTRLTRVNALLEVL